MLFNSQIFIFLFLPLTLIGWYFLNHLGKYRLSLLFLVGMSLWFYGYFHPGYLVIILGSMAANYLVSFLMDRYSSQKKLFFYMGLMANIGLLGYYKYYDFFVENINWVFGSDFTLKHIILPLGISFFTLQQISYLIDRYWGTAGHYDLLHYMAFVTFFPQLIAGPIVLHSELIPQFQDLEKRKFDLQYFWDGLVLFVLGLVKKVLIADLFALVVNFGFEKIYYLDTLSAWMVALSYAIELYFDFSGYCDMACGIGKMFHYELPVNFNSPYKSHSVPEYWNRWHYTLTRFFTTYIYMPLTMTGLRRNKRQLYGVLAPMVVFLISGFWHGASWTFVLWGLAQGVATVWAQRKHWKLKKSWFTWAGTFFFAVVTQAIFRSETITNMRLILKAMFVPKHSGFLFELTSCLKQVPEFFVLTRFGELLGWQVAKWIYLLLFVVILAIAIWILKGRNAHEILKYQKEKGFAPGFVIGLAFLLMWCIISLNQVSTFLYFNF